jgi:hypothetical protein
MADEERIQSALHSPEPVPALRALVQDLAREGSTKAAIYGLLEKFVVQQRKRQDLREADEDAVLDVLDALSGWCHPTAELLPEKPVG